MKYIFLGEKNVVMAHFLTHLPGKTSCMKWPLPWNCIVAGSGGTYLPFKLKLQTVSGSPCYKNQYEQVTPYRRPSLAQTSLFW